MKKTQLIVSLFFLNILITINAQTLFFDDFENGLNNWEYKDNNLCRLQQSSDTSHKKVLELTPNRTANCILIIESQKWNAFSIEGDILFPTDEHNYMGFVFNFKHKNNRDDFGCIYIKGNGSYIRVNPHYDGNASRDIYEEYKTPLTDNDKIIINKWIRFKAEIIENTCHFYVNDMKVPKIIFNYDENNEGLTGFKPRFAGGVCQIDNISVKKIKKFSYSDDNIHSNIQYLPDSLITSWRITGPYNQRIADIENGKDSNDYKWKVFDSDYRGCNVAGKICRYSTDEKYCYYLTEINSVDEGTFSLKFSSTDILHIWVNDRYEGKIENQMYVWYDFFRNPDHSGNEIKVELKKGINKILLLVEGGHYGGDGFYTFLKNN